MKTTPKAKPTRRLVACRLDGKNEVFEFSTKADAQDFARDCKARGVKTMISKWAH